MSEDAETDPTPVEVDHRRLSPEALQGVLESFVNREGTDYGLHEKTLAEKVADVRRQLDQGKARLVYDPETESIDITPAEPRPRSGSARR